MQDATPSGGTPTVVLVHGAFADASGWAGVIAELQGDGISVMAPANPLRGVAADAKSVSDLVRTIDGPVMLVGHSYGGAVISNVDSDAGKITGLRGEAVRVDQPDDLAGVGRDVRDHRAAVGVGSEHDRSVD